jgi:hypothetical protein
VTSIERTAYPQFRRLTSARVLHVFFTPAEDEVAWARERTETRRALLDLKTSKTLTLGVLDVGQFSVVCPCEVAF